ncbi:ABC transporter ATP-binding protein [Campylobacter sp. MIT 12-5580]|uniref:energy-coupling factor ABC transporter ATP-binding protein n=1 Tax=Campylobacter sp. MIT 12-5580 TaxID=2040651 RepID=UPI0010F95DBA|nr:ABC transporter ATP-binding protein [Campylobacter sp. MIT 12-5580]TKX29659.1 ABC transporter ATP-binding protein [Campylobacter sp. MIT 12-5580]
MNEIVNLSLISMKIYDRLLFENINLSLKEGESISIFGENGIGKSTLLELIAGLKRQEKGVLRLFDEEMKTLKDFEKQRLKIAYLFQNPRDQFICPIVLEDVIFSLLNANLSKDEAIFKGEAMLKKLDIFHLKDKIVFELSGGEQKLVALAGILICKPKLLLLDEPNSNLDTKNEEKLIHILKECKASKIIISHDKNFSLKLSDKLYTLTKNALLSYY